MRQDKFRFYDVNGFSNNIVVPRIVPYVTVWFGAVRMNEGPACMFLFALKIALFLFYLASLVTIWHS